MDYARARQIFLDYNGITFGMARNGILEEYKNAKVPKELELQWKEEVLEELREKMKLDHPPRTSWGIISDYFMANQEFYKKDSIDFIRENKEKIQDMDDLSKLIVIEMIFNLSLPEEPEKRKLVIEKCVKRLYDMLEKEAKGEFVIDESYYEQGQIPDYLADGKLEERLDRILCKFLDKKNGV